MGETIDPITGLPKSAVKRDASGRLTRNENSKYFKGSSSSSSSRSGMSSKPSSSSSRSGLSSSKPSKSSSSGGSSSGGSKPSSSGSSGHGRHRPRPSRPSSSSSSSSSGGSKKPPFTPISYREALEKKMKENPPSQFHPSSSGSSKPSTATAPSDAVYKPQQPQPIGGKTPQEAANKPNNALNPRVRQAPKQIKTSAGTYYYDPNTNTYYRVRDDGYKDRISYEYAMRLAAKYDATMAKTTTTTPPKGMSPYEKGSNPPLEIRGEGYDLEVRGTAPGQTIYIGDTRLEWDAQQGAWVDKDTGYKWSPRKVGRQYKTGRVTDNPLASGWYENKMDVLAAQSPEKALALSMQVAKELKAKGYTDYLIEVESPAYGGKLTLAPAVNEYEAEALQTALNKWTTKYNRLVQTSYERAAAEEMKFYPKKNVAYDIVTGQFVDVSPEAIRQRAYEKAALQQWGMPYEKLPEPYKKAIQNSPLVKDWIEAAQHIAADRVIGVNEQWQGYNMRGFIFPEAPKLYKGEKPANIRANLEKLLNKTSYGTAASLDRAMQEQGLRLKTISNQNGHVVIDVVDKQGVTHQFELMQLKNGQYQVVPTREELQLMQQQAAQANQQRTATLAQFGASLAQFKKESPDLYSTLFGSSTPTLGEYNKKMAAFSLGPKTNPIEFAAATMALQSKGYSFMPAASPEGSPIFLKVEQPQVPQQAALSKGQQEFKPKTATGRALKAGEEAIQELSQGIVKGGQQLAANIKSSPVPTGGIFGFELPFVREAAAGATKAGTELLAGGIAFAGEGIKTVAGAGIATAEMAANAAKGRSTHQMTKEFMESPVGLVPTLKSTGEGIVTMFVSPIQHGAHAFELAASGQPGAVEELTYAVGMGAAAFSMAKAGSKWALEKADIALEKHGLKEPVKVEYEVEGKKVKVEGTKYKVPKTDLSLEKVTITEVSTPKVDIFTEWRDVVEGKEIGRFKTEPLEAKKIKKIELFKGKELVKSIPLEELSIWSKEIEGKYWAKGKEGVSVWGRGSEKGCRHVRGNNFVEQTMSKSQIETTTKPLLGPEETSTIIKGTSTSRIGEVAAKKSRAAKLYIGANEAGRPKLFLRPALYDVKVRELYSLKTSWEWMKKGEDVFAKSLKAKETLGSEPKGTTARMVNIAPKAETGTLTWEKGLKLEPKTRGFVRGFGIEEAFGKFTEEPIGLRAKVEPGGIFTEPLGKGKVRYLREVEENPLLPKQEGPRYGKSARDLYLKKEGTTKAKGSGLFDLGKESKRSGLGEGFKDIKGGRNVIGQGRTATEQLLKGKEKTTQRTGLLEKAKVEEKLDLMEETKAKTVPQPDVERLFNIGKKAKKTARGGLGLLPKAATGAVAGMGVVSEQKAKLAGIGLQPKAPKAPKLKTATKLFTLPKINMGVGNAQAAKLKGKALPLLTVKPGQQPSLAPKLAVTPKTATTTTVTPTQQQPPIISPTIPPTAPTSLITPPPGQQPSVGLFGGGAGSPPLLGGFFGLGKAEKKRGKKEVASDLAGILTVKAGGKVKSTEEEMFSGLGKRYVRKGRGGLL